MNCILSSLQQVSDFFHSVTSPSYSSINNTSQIPSNTSNTPSPSTTQSSYEEIHVSEENVIELMVSEWMCFDLQNMGFEEEESREALHQCYNDLNAAANRLLSS